MIKIFLSHSVKRFFRSPSVGKDITVQWVFGLLILITAVYALAFGFELNSLITERLKQPDAISFLNRMLFYYFLAETTIRYFLLPVPAMDVRPYLHLPIPSRSIANFLLGKSILNFFNVLVLLVFTPFALNVIIKEHGLPAACAWLSTLFLISIVGHFFIILLKQNVAKSIGSILILLPVCCAVLGGIYYDLIGVQSLSLEFFNSAMDSFRLPLILLPVIAVLYYLSYRTILRSFRTDKNEERINLKTSGLPLSRYFGVTGAWMQTEIKLIGRNRRSRELFLMHVVVFASTLLFLSVGDLNKFDRLFFIGMMSSAFFLINYGAYLFSWQGSHFDFMLTRPATVRQFIGAKFWLFAISIALGFLLTLPLAFVGWQIVFVSLVCTIYNIGINIFLVMIISMWGARRIDLTHPGSLNLEGMGAAQWLVMFPTLFGPVFLFGPFMNSYPMTSLLVAGILGLTGIFFQRNLLNVAARRLTNMRYVRAANFRKE